MRSEVKEGDGARRDDGQNGELATPAADDDDHARGWDVVVQAGEKPAIAGTQDRLSDTAMSFIF
jgi:hypothetical protein